MRDNISLWWAVSCLKRLVTGISPKARVRSLIRPCEICGGQSGTWTRFSPSTSRFPPHYHSVSAPYKPIFACSSYHKGKSRRSPRTFQQVMLFRRSGSNG